MHDFIAQSVKQSIKKTTPTAKASYASRYNEIGKNPPKTKISLVFIIALIGVNAQ